VKLALIVLGLVIVGGAAVEIGLRLLFGFGKPPLYVADTQVGYRLAPNQRTRRFGNRFEINQYSMRGSAIAPMPQPGTLRVLLVGDSIANGGWWTDQADILSERIEQRLAATTSDAYDAVEVLNASANSWGPRNELAYLFKFGTFGAQVIVLLINTDDLFAATPNSIPVGRDRAYPDKYPPLALVEVLSRLRKPKPLPELEAINNEGGDRVGVNLEAIRQMQRIAQENDSRLILAMTPLLREVVPPGSRDYELKARDRLTRLAETEQIQYIDFLASFESSSSPEELYRDHIHLSRAGYTLVNQTLSDAVQANLRPSLTGERSLPDSLLEDPW